ncbi:hypothetical protein MRX96_057578 [Rhipicephalus microplus]
MEKFNEDVMAHWAECTAAENQTCQIVENLSILNKLLRGSVRELRELVVDALLQLLQKSSCLETLRLIGFPLRAREADTFFTALSRRCWLRELSINMNLLEPEHCPHALIEYLTTTAFLEGETKKQRALLLESSVATRQWPLCVYCRAVVISTSIKIRINRGNVAVSSAFAEFLKSSTALRKLNLSAGLDSPLETDGDTRWWSLLHKALRQNSSLRDLSITLYGMSVQEMEALAESVGRSTSIRWVHVQPRPITNASAFVRRFSKDIERNHTLLTLICEGHIDTVVAEHWYVVQETTRRNSGVVARAARLQKAALLDSILRCWFEVAELLKVERAELVNSIRDRLEGLETLDGFMKLAGVVEERVVCHPSDDGCTQLDALNEDCWRHIRQYLFLDDVKEGIGRHGKALSCKDLTRGNDASRMI